MKVPDFDTDQWTYLFGVSQYQYPFDPDDSDSPRLDNEYTEEFYQNVMRQRDVRPATIPFAPPTNNAGPPPFEAPPAPPPSSPPQRENAIPDGQADGDVNIESSTPVRSVTWAPDVALPAPDPPLPAQQLRPSTRHNFG